MSMAIKYQMQKRKKMAMGGDTYRSDSTSRNDPTEMCPVHGKSGCEICMAEGGGVHEPWTPLEGVEGKQSEAGVHVSAAHKLKGLKNPLFDKTISGLTDKAKELHRKKLEELQSDKGDRKYLAEGGQVTDNYQPSGMVKTRPDLEDHEFDNISYKDHEDGGTRKANSRAMIESDRSLGQHGEYEEGDEGTDEGNGPQPDRILGRHHDPRDNYQTEDHEEDMVGRIMKQRAQHFSKGGRVANQDTNVTDEMPNEFDDLHLRDDLESSYTGANSGDQIGDEQEDYDRKDIVSRIMRSRAKKDRMPRPA